ncbi:Cell wall-associated polypeptide CWBP200 [Legionella massiliensis]|uniref:Cell wall-associated polypeptide CWBP200 n=1 Tax=Legionella massiliensis TaxID=1034943 RepID=A0A078KYM5_9GAMM|nr:DUF6531 domain-containing protein [Legionella massiliensis]CDZ78026.1 Cell wall-associated polypeptide CWBP200 [Legionella massiliensis]CEE13764.1 Putative deoxyribonuclease RhsC [Legionella massiliensis]
MTQIFTNEGLGIASSSINQLGSYGPKTDATLGQGGESVYVNAANGNMVIRQNDGFLAGTGLGLDLIQSYNSLGESGHNWSFNVQTRLIINGAINSPGSEVLRIDEDGHSSCFIFDQTKGYYVAEHGGTAKLSFSNNQWSYREGASSSSYIYDANGLLIKLTDRDGHQLQFFYKQGQLERIIDNSGNQTIEWTFEQGLLRDILTLSAGEQVHHLHYDYDAQQRLTKVSRDLGEGKTYWLTYECHGDSNRISAIRQSDGSSLLIDYDSEGRVKTIADGENRITSYQYWPGVTIVTNSLGENWAYFYDEKGHLTGIDSPLNNPIRYAYKGDYITEVYQGDLHWSLAYNEAGDCIRIEEPSGQVTTRTYNNDHLLLSESSFTIFDGNHQPAKPKANRFVYDELGHLRFQIASDGTVTEYRYNQEGQCLTVRSYLQSSYDLSQLANEQALTLNHMLNWVNSQNPQAVSLKGYHYDWRGLLDEEVSYSEINANGEGLSNKSIINRYHYDAAGKLLQKSEGGKTTSYLYDDLGRLILRRDSQNHCERFEYDDANQRIIETDAKGLQTIRTYDRGGLLLTTQYLSGTQQAYGTIHYRYDSVGRLQEELSADGKATYYFYDSNGQLKAKCEPGGRLSSYSYDAVGRLVQAISYQERLDTSGWHESMPAWSALNVKADAKDRINQTIYNAHNQIAYQIDSEGAVIAFEYNPQGQLTKKTAYANRLSSYQSRQPLSFDSIVVQFSNDDRSCFYFYDSAGRLEAEINGEGGATSYRYDRQGHLLETIRYFNRLPLPPGLEWTVPKASASDIHNFSLYNPAGLKVADIDALGYTTTYEYDERGLLIKKRSLATAVKIKINAGTTLSALGLQENDNDHLSVYNYDELGQLIEQREQNGLITRYRYDEKGLVLAKTLIDAKTQELREQRFRYDSLGRVSQSLDALGAAKLLANPQISQAEIELIWQEHSLHYDYDLAGRVISQTNALNQKTRYFYNEAGLLRYTVNADGGVSEQQFNAFNQIETSYRYSRKLTANLDSLTSSDLANRLAQLKDEAADEKISYEYNSLGFLIKKTKGSKGQELSSYNSFGEIEETRQNIDSRSLVNRYIYDRRGLICQQIEDVEGLKRETKSNYDSFGRLVKAIDGRGGITNYILNRRGERVIIQNQDKKNKVITYDAFGRILIETDFTGTKRIDIYSYDDKNNTVTLNHPDEKISIQTTFNAFGDKVSLTDGNGYTTAYHYDAKGQLIEVDAPEGSTKQYDYDAAGNLVLELDSAGHRIAYSYDASGRILRKTIDPQGLALVSSYHYDGLGRQLEVIEANGLHKRFSYDDRSNLIQTTIDPDGLNLITRFYYDARDLIIKQVECDLAGKSKVTTYEWDNLGRRTAVSIDPEGLNLTTRYGYDLNDNLISQTDAKNQTSYFIYDAKNQCRYQIDARGVVTEHLFNMKGNEIQKVVYANRLALTRDYTLAELASQVQASDQDHYEFRTFDSLGRLSLSFDSMGYATSYTYDANSNLLEIVRSAQALPLAELKAGSMRFPKGGLRTQRFAYDGLNRLVYQVDEANGITQFDYDSSGQVIAKTRYAIGLSLAGNSYTLEDLKRAIQYSPAKDEYTAYAYDQAGRLSYKASADGAVSSYSYDGLGNLISSRAYATRLEPASLKQANWQSLLSPNDQDRMTRFFFDIAGREVYRVSPEGRILERCYDALGNVVAEIAHDIRLDSNVASFAEITMRLNADSAARKTRYAYDLAGRLEIKTDANHQQTRYGYDNNNNVTTKIEANSARWTYIYDEANQLIEAYSPLTEVMSQASGWNRQMRSIVTRNVYDSFGNIIETIHDAEGSQQKINYRYDTNNRKIQTIYPNVAVNAATNQASAARQEELRTLSEDHQYNAFGELIASKDRAGNWRYKDYDKKGNLIYSLDAQGALTGYSYDLFGNLVSKTAYANPYSIAEHPDFSADTIKNACIANEADRTESYDYGLENRLIETRKPGVKSYNAQTNRYETLNPLETKSYNAFGELVLTAVKRNETDWAKTTNYYDKDGLKIAGLDAEHYLSTYTYNNFGELVDEVQYANRATAWDTKAVTNPVADSKDRHVTFSYDNIGRLETKTLKNIRYERLIGSSNRYESLTSDLTTSFRYDAMGNLTSTTDPLGYSSYCYYDALGQLVAKIGPRTEAGRAATSYGYDGLGQLVELIRYEQGAQEADVNHYLVQASVNDHHNRTIYDNQGKVITTIDAIEHEINYSYDASGQLQRSWELLSQVDGSKRLSDKRYSYDKEGHLLQTAIFKNDGQFRTEDASYNIFGELIAKGLNGKLSTHIDYDNLGRAWRSNTEGYYQIFLYDLTDKVAQIVTASNAISPEYGAKGIDLSLLNYDNSERFGDFERRFSLQRQNNIYDGLGRCLQQTKEFSLANKNSEQTPELRQLSQLESVDRWGNVLSHTNAKGYKTSYEYNAFDQLIKQELPEVIVLNEKFQQQSQKPTLYYAYDALGRAIALTDANGHTLAKILDAEGQVLSEIDAKGIERIKTYDLFGQLRTSKNELQGLTTYVYDKAKRLINLSTPTSKQSYAYDEIGKLLSQSDAPERAVLFQYDNLGNQITKLDGNKRLTIYAYDDAGNKIFEQDMNGHNQSWSYDEQGRLLSHRDLGNHETSYQYNNNGLLLEETSTAGKNLSYSYEGDGQLWSFTDHSYNEVSYYLYDDEGNIQSKTISRATQGRDRGWKSQQDIYDYDALGRLTSVKRNESDDKDYRFPEKDHQLLEVNYSYDAVGNIIRTQAMANYTGYQKVQSDDYFSYDANNRMLVNKGFLVNGELVINGPQRSRLVYDDAGNVKDAFIVENGALQQYTYNYNNDSQLQQIYKNGSILKAIAYDDFGRVEKEYLYDAFGQATEITVMGYEGDLLKTQTKYSPNLIPTELNEYHYDNVGNLQSVTSRLINNNMIIDSTHVYDYELWDNYLQSKDSVAMSVNGGIPTFGENRRFYDVNGQLYQSIDQQTNSQGKSNSAAYKTSTLEGIRSRVDAQGERNYLTLAGKTIGDLQLDTNGVQHLNIYGGFTPTGKPISQGSPSLNRAVLPLGNTIGFFSRGNEVGVSSETTENILANTPQDNTGTYTIQSGDSLESIALQVYGDSSFWYLIADANGISDRTDASQLQTGKRLIIPAVATRQHQNSGTHRLLSSEELLGDLSATVPMPATKSFSPHQKKHHSLFKKIAVAAISMVATVIAAAACAALGGALGAASLGKILSLGMKVLSGQILGTAGSIAAGFTAGVAGNLAGQGLAKILGLQEKINWRSTLITGLSSAASTGLLRGLSSNQAYKDIIGKLDNISPLSFSLSSAAQMMEQDAIGQGVSLALQNHQHFNWLELGTRGAIAAVAGSSYGKNFNQSLVDHLGEGGSALVHSELSALATNGMQTAINEGHFDATQILTDNLGSAIGTGFVNAQAAAAEQEERLAAIQSEIATMETPNCPIPITEEETFSPIPEGTYERFHQERAQREFYESITEKANELWNDYGDKILTHSPKVLGVWLTGNPDNQLEKAFEDAITRGTINTYTQIAKSELELTGLPKTTAYLGKHSDDIAQALGGALGMSITAAVITAAGVSNPVLALGALLYLNSIDNTLTGIRNIATDNHYGTQTLGLLRKIPLSEEHAVQADQLIPLVSNPMVAAEKSLLKMTNYTGKTLYAHKEQTALKATYLKETLKNPVVKSVMGYSALNGASGIYGAVAAGGDGYDMVAGAATGVFITLGSTYSRYRVILKNPYVSNGLSNFLGQSYSYIRDPQTHHYSFVSLSATMLGVAKANQVTRYINVPITKTVIDGMIINSATAVGNNLGNQLRK